MTDGMRLLIVITVGLTLLWARGMWEHYCTTEYVDPDARKTHQLYLNFGALFLIGFWVAGLNAIGVIDWTPFP